MTAAGQKMAAKAGLAWNRRSARWLLPRAGRAPAPLPGATSASRPLRLIGEQRAPYSGATPAAAKGAGRLLSEAELSWIWEGQRQPAAALALADGTAVT